MVTTPLWSGSVTVRRGGSGWVVVVALARGTVVDVVVGGTVVANEACVVVVEGRLAVSTAAGALQLATVARINTAMTVDARVISSPR